MVSLSESWEDESMFCPCSVHVHTGPRHSVAASVGVGSGSSSSSSSGIGTDSGFASGNWLRYTLHIYLSIYIVLDIYVPHGLVAL